MKNQTIGQRIIAGFAAIVVICAGLGIFSVFQLRAISTLSSVTTTESLEGMDCVGRIESVAHENNLLLIKNLMTKNEDLKTDLEQQLQTNLCLMATINLEYKKHKTSAAAQAALEVFDTARQNYANALNEVIKLSRDQKNQEAMELKQSKVDKFLATIQAEGQANKQSGQAAAAQVQSTARHTQISILIGFLIMLLAAVGIGWSIILVTNRVLTAISAQLSSGSIQILAAATQVATASQSLADGSSEQASSVEEASSSLEEMSSMTKRNAQNASKANDLAKQTRAVADKGAEDMQGMSAAMQAIKNSSDDIAKIIKTIDEIAFQTNILALNAAVEAARAGEAGMGFAVVADEVRNLAQRSAVAAKETAVKIEGAINNTYHGVQLSGKVTITLNDIVVKAREMDELAAEVADASHEQTQGISQINTAVGQMDKVTQSNTANAEETAAAAEELTAQAEALKQSVDDLLKLVDGQDTHALTNPVGQRPAKQIFTQRATAKTATANHSSHSASNGSATRRTEIPMADSFKDF